MAEELRGLPGVAHERHRLVSLGELRVELDELLGFGGALRMDRRRLHRRHALLHRLLEAGVQLIRRQLVAAVVGVL